MKHTTPVTPITAMEERTAVFWSHTSRLYVPALLIAALPAWTHE
jgi:hypothetical protein